MKILTPEEQPQWNSIIIDILKRFISICKENNLTYFCGGGTAIGAVRHHGMIPWDDDIDVFMPRPDYDRFISIASSMDLGKYELVTPFIKKDYPLYFSKLCNRETTLQEVENIPCVYGLYVDIFPVDGAPDDLELGQRRERKFRKLRYALSSICERTTFMEHIKLLFKRKEWGRFVWKTIGFFFRSSYRKWLLSQMDNLCYEYDYASSNNVAIYCGSYGYKEVLPKKWVDGVASTSFEGLEVDIPCEYDKFLTHYFDDYMQLPPIEQRVAHHLKVYFNLNEKEPDEIVAQKIRQSNSRSISTV